MQSLLILVVLLSSKFKPQYEVSTSSPSFYDNFLSMLLCDVLVDNE